MTDLCPLQITLPGHLGPSVNSCLMVGSALDDKILTYLDNKVNKFNAFPTA